MEIVRNLKVPTGNILIVKGEKGNSLELLSIGDYGKEKNVKADFMGLAREIEGVPHGDLLPLEDKWVITVSSQYGYSMNCVFCDVPKVGSGINATHDDIVGQVKTGIGLHPEVKHTDRLNVHYARMGEPTWNKAILTATKELAMDLKARGWGFHPVVSTMMPKNNKKLQQFLDEWMFIKNSDLDGEAGLQLSINTTDDKLRQLSMSNNTLSLQEISNMVKGYRPRGRKITLNFALTDAPIDENKLVKLFDPRYFICKITPMHMTKSCEDNNIMTVDGYEKFYPYKDIERKLKAVGYDVIVFIPSYEEDLGRITCGNAILSGNMPETEYKDILS